MTGRFHRSFKSFFAADCEDGAIWCYLGLAAHHNESKARTMHIARKPQLDIEWAVSPRLTGYQDASEFMQQRARAIATGAAPELIWLLEHPALYTAGTSAKPADLLNPDLLPVHQAGRGGQYTYHGPGQRIAYVMLNLKQRGGDVRALVDQLERWVVTALAEFNVHGETIPGQVGIWVRRTAKDGGHDVDKVAALGLRVSQGVTTHGISINVAPDLTHYRGIVACGLRDRGVTSLANLGLPVGMADLDRAMRRAFQSIFGDVRIVPPPPLSVAAAQAHTGGDHPG